MKGQHVSDAMARTVAVNAITIGQCFYLLNSRYLIDSSVSIRAHLENKYLPIGIGAVIVLQLMFTYLPPLQRIFETEAVPLYVWPWLLGGGLLFFFFVEAEKMTIRFYRKSSLSAAVVVGSGGLSATPECDERHGNL
jgi:magnesium-transporting ATPase (P-type)